VKPSKFPGSPRIVDVPRAFLGTAIEELLLTAFRTVAVYALMPTVVRALGRRTVGNLSAFEVADPRFSQYFRRHDFATSPL